MDSFDFNSCLIMFIYLLYDLMTIKANYERNPLDVPMLKTFRCI